MFQKNKIADLTQRAQKAYDETMKIGNCNPMNPLQLNDINWVERELKICFSDDFVEINQIFDYAYLGSFEFNALYYQGRSGVVEETIGNREALNLPNRYVILCIEDDVSVLLLETQDSPEKPSPVIWCDMFPDFFNICKGKPMEQNPTIWPSFTDFFEYLVEQEEAAIQKETK